MTYCLQDSLFHLSSFNNIFRVYNDFIIQIDFCKVFFIGSFIGYSKKLIIFCAYLIYFFENRCARSVYDINPIFITFLYECRNGNLKPFLKFIFYIGSIFSLFIKLEIFVFNSEITRKPAIRPFIKILKLCFDFYVFNIYIYGFFGVYIVYIILCNLTYEIPSEIFNYAAKRISFYFRFAVIYWLNVFDALYIR